MGRVCNFDWTTELPAFVLPLRSILLHRAHPKGAGQAGRFRPKRVTATCLYASGERAHTKGSRCWTVSPVDMTPSQMLPRVRSLPRNKRVTEIPSACARDFSEIASGALKEPRRPSTSFARQQFLVLSANQISTAHASSRSDALVFHLNTKFPEQLVPGQQWQPLFDR